MTQSSNIGMLVNHAEIDHLLTSMSDSLRNAAYKVANEIAPKGSEKYSEFFDDVGTLIGYDEDTNKAMLRDCLDHYVQYANSFGSAERMDFNYYLETNFQMVLPYITSRPEVMSYLTSLFATACGILSSVLHPVIEDIYARGQLIDKIESFVTGTDNTYYLVYGEDIDNPETYDPKEDDLSDVDVSQSPEVLQRLSAVETRRREDDKANAAWSEYSKSLHAALNEPGALLNHLVKSRYKTSVHRLHPTTGEQEPVSEHTTTFEPEKFPHFVKVTDQSIRPSTPPEPLPRHPHIPPTNLNLVWHAPGTELL